MDEQVKDYIKKLSPKCRDIALAIRSLIFEVYPHIKESFKNGAPWYEGRYYIAGFKDHVNLGLSINGLSVKELQELEGAGRYMRHIKITSLESFDKERVMHLLRMCHQACEDDTK